MFDKEKISLLDFGGGSGETYIDYINKLRTKKIIDYYLDLYNAREELVLSAVAAGVLSKSDGN